MKHIFKTTLIIIVLLFLSSCGSNNIVEDEPEQENYFIKSKIAGETFFSDFPIILVNLSGTNDITISGQNEENTTSVQIQIKNYTGSGTYISGDAIDNENGFLIINPDGSWFTNKDYGTGTVTINENGNILTGTFSLTAIKPMDNTSMEITEGSFRILKLT